MPLFLNTILVTGPADEVARVTVEHRNHLQRLREQGRIRWIGEFTREDGFVELFEAKDVLEADQIARSSPLIEAGLAAWILRELETVSGTV